MSRLGKKPVAIPEGVKIAVEGRTISVEGPLGKLSYDHRPEVAIEVDADANQVVVSAQGDSRESKAFHGLTRALVAIMLGGVHTGYEKRLEIVGVGYLAAVQGDTLQLRVGFANEVHKKIPTDLNVTCPDQTHVLVKGID
jgi:large subunit ribosomal protein L6